MTIEFETAWLSSAGGREDNEDSCGFRMQQGSGCWVLCDGLGGHSGGEVASRLATDAALKSFDADPCVDGSRIAAHIDRAHAAVIDGQREQPELAAMRTTVVMLLASANAGLWAHCGDSRLYWFQNGTLRGQTHDDSVPQRLADAGEIAPEQIRFHEDRGRLLRSLGARPEPQATFAALETAPQAGDTFLLASDGFWEWVNEAEMQEDLASAPIPGDWLAMMELRILSRIPGDHDNYSAIAIACKEAG